MRVKVTLTIVAYRDYQDIERALASIFDLSNIVPVVYIVDNSCYSDTNVEKTAFKEAISLNENVVFLDTKSNLGFGKGHNYILNIIDSEYHIICNPDVVVRHGAIDNIISYMDKNPDVGMCIPRIEDEAGNLQYAYRKNPTVFDMFIRMFCPKLFPKRIEKHTLQDADYAHPFQVPFGQGCFFVIRTKLFKELGGFDDRFFMYMEDADLSRRVNEVSRLVYCPEATVVHRWEKGSHKNRKLFKTHIRSMIRYFNKWGWKLI